MSRASAAVVLAVVALLPFLAGARSCAAHNVGPDQATVTSRTRSGVSQLRLGLKFSSDGHTGQQSYDSFTAVPNCRVGALWPRCTGEW